MPTYASRRSSSSSRVSPSERRCRNTPSSRPLRNTTGNSNPLAVCSVIRVTTPWWSGSSDGIWSASATSATCSRKPARVAVSSPASTRSVYSRGTLARPHPLRVLAGDARQLLQVLHPARVLRVDALLQLGQVAGALQGGLQDLL